MSWAELENLTAAASPALCAVALCAARLIPVTFLCPILGGPMAPITARLGVVLSLSLSLHLAGGVTVPVPVTDGLVFLALAGKELMLGTAVGLLAALPFDAARMGGRLIDLFRGSSAEAALPGVGSRESATGEGLYQLLLALAVTGAGLPVALAGLWKSFGVLRLGAYVATESQALYLVQLAGVALATGLAVGAPIAGAVMAADWLVALVSRTASPVNLSELGSPLRILGGGAVVWLGLGVLSERLLSGVEGVEEGIRLLLELGR